MLEPDSIACADSGGNTVRTGGSPSKSLNFIPATLNVFIAAAQSVPVPKGLGGAGQGSGAPFEGNWSIEVPFARMASNKHSVPCY